MTSTSTRTYPLIISTGRHRYPLTPLLTNRRHRRLHRTTTRRQLRSCIQYLFSEMVSHKMHGRRFFVNMTDIWQLAHHCRLGVSPHQPGLRWQDRNEERTRIGWYEQLLVSELKVGGTEWKNSGVWKDLYEREVRAWQKREREERQREETGEILREGRGVIGPGFWTDSDSSDNELHEDLD